MSKLTITKEVMKDVSPLHLDGIEIHSPEHFNKEMIPERDILRL